MITSLTIPLAVLPLAVLLVVTSRFHVENLSLENDALHIVAVNCEQIYQPQLNTCHHWNPLRKNLTKLSGLIV